ncbi:putative U3 small nucleolar RNA-associated protein 18 [Hypsizygus marmoreus]|uniref:U3 small nucleolar RNA-associated protein 18 n=1 Tax=Hypsizygus marmoreus TaxID=39966 RepID=A0A369K019_HYPMA|nr:putative U3 small nucleolar RNA-associated protein 18 [Hypsizygus marmoreus]
MAKHPHKKQKTLKEIKDIQPLGINLLTDDASKDDEERRLESILFSTKFVPRENEISTSPGDKSDDAGGGGNAMNHLTDTDLFFIDHGSLMPDVNDSNEYGDDNDEKDSDLEAPEEPESDTSDSGAESSSSQSQRIPSNVLPKTRKPPAWVDPSDTPTVSLSAPRLRKLRDTAAEESVSGREYETRLRRQYERINPEPSWAAKARKTRREEIEDEEGDLRGLLSSTSGILAPSKRKSRAGVIVPAGTLEIERLRDANQAAQGSGSGEVKVVAFHPSDRVPVLCVGTADRRIRLFNVDGHTSPLLQTLHVPSLPLISQNSATFHPLGSSLLLTGPRPFFYTHDLQAGVTTRHARGLWGTTFSSVNDAAPGSSRKRGRHRGGQQNGDTSSGGGGGGEGMEITAFSPHTGEILAVAGRGGYVHLVDWKSGAGQVIGSLKCGGGGGGVRALWWAPDSSAADSVLGGGASVGEGRQHLAVLSGDAEVYLWDVGERRCVRRWKDEGGFRGAGRVMAGTAAGGNGGYLAVGSNTGFVNVYGSDSFAPPSSSSTTISATELGGTPKPIKHVANLTTAISTLRFNHDAQLMAMASQEKKDAMRLIHLPSLTSFSNWPTSSTPLGHVTAIDFSARSEYLAVGNTRGRVLLYHLKDYGVGA